MYQKMIEEEDTIYELDEECINQKIEERENQRIQGKEKKERERNI